MEREASARNPVYMFKAFYSQIDREFLNMSKATKLNVPTLFIGADCDNICPAGPIKDLSQRLGCQYVVAKDCGHQCMQEDPKQINGYIGDFLSSLQ
jgi:pimeloyl-ACP methyl ester carboxylesterase